jgi:hypothetical protein
MEGPRLFNSGLHRWTSGSSLQLKIKNAAGRCGCGEGGNHEVAIGLVRLNCLVAACARAVFCPAE